ncbi:MAG: DUF262 domain-containing protein [Flavobacterium sp.]|nr:MAG: DUF262 domain-containing protein [Flavobacterium sp.]
MVVKVTTWKVSTLWRLREKINPQPPYQRGEVWSPRKSALLIDSILRGIDIPKIYLRKLDRNAHDYEIADGQQRLSAILSFYNNEFALLADDEKGLNLRRVGNSVIGGKTFAQLNEELRHKFSDYEVTIAIVEEATGAEIRTLFGRLQEGEPLVPAEKRNAIISKIGGFIDNFAIHHDFFINSKIPAARYKRQDYLSHGLALVFYELNSPLKADLLLRMYLDKDLAITQELQSKVEAILSVLRAIDQRSNTRIFKKFHFIDFFWCVFQNFRLISTFHENTIARNFDEFETRRLGVKNPEDLIVGRPSQNDLDLYRYYHAFRAAGSEPHKTAAVL